MKKVLTAAMTALTLVTALGTGATAASADEYRGRDERHSWSGQDRGGRVESRDWDRGERRHRDRDRDTGALIGVGILGFAIGAAIASSDRHPAPPPEPVYYREPPPAYYNGPYYYGYAGECRVHYRWDSYYRRYVEIERCY
jgi:hypothetical protein